MRLLAFLSLLALVPQESAAASLPRKERKRREEQMPREGDSFEVLPLGNDVLNPDNYGEVIDLSNYEELTDYGDQLPEVRDTGDQLIPCMTLGVRGPGPPTCPIVWVSQASTSFSMRWKFLSLHRDLSLR